MTDETVVPVKPKRARKPRQPKPDVAQAQADIASPTIAFYAGLSERIADNARIEITEIELRWTDLRMRWIELTTLLASIDAANAVMGGDPASTAPDLEHPGGAQALADLQRQIEDDIRRNGGPAS